MKIIDESKLNCFINYLNDNLNLNINNGASLSIKVNWVKRYSNLIESRLLGNMYEPYIEVYKNCLDW